MASNQHSLIFKYNNYTLITITQVRNYFCPSISIQGHSYVTYFDLSVSILCLKTCFYLNSVLWVLCVSLSDDFVVVWMEDFGLLKFLTFHSSLKDFASIPGVSFLPYYLFILLTGDVLVPLITQNHFFFK